MSKQVSIFENNTGVTVSTPRKGALGDVFAPATTVSNTRRIQARNNGDFVRIISGQQAGDPVRDALNVIIVGAHKEVSREFYGSEYDPDNPTLPDCWSNKGDAPDEGCSNPQSSACASCPQNVKNPNGRRPCKFQRRIAVIVEGDPKGTVYQFKIPSKSLFGKGVGNTHPFESYTKFLAGNGESPDTVVTQIAHDPNNQSQTYVLNFKPVRQVSDEEYELVLAAQKNPDTDMYTKITTAQADQGTALPPSAQIGYSDEPDEEEDTPAVEEAKPAKRQAKKAEPKPETNSLADVVSAWSDDD